MTSLISAVVVLQQRCHHLDGHLFAQRVERQAEFQTESSDRAPGRHRSGCRAGKPGSSAVRSPTTRRKRWQKKAPLRVGHAVHGEPGIGMTRPDRRTGQHTAATVDDQTANLTRVGLRGHSGRHQPDHADYGADVSCHSPRALPLHAGACPRSNISQRSVGARAAPTQPQAEGRRPPPVCSLDSNDNADRDQATISRAGGGQTRGQARP